MLSRECHQSLTMLLRQSHHSLTMLTMLSGEAINCGEGIAQETDRDEIGIRGDSRRNMSPSRGRSLVVNMDVVVLNELLRDEFASVVKGFGAVRRARVTLIAAAEAEAKAKAAAKAANAKDTQAPPAGDGDGADALTRPPLDVPPPPQFMTLAKSILRRLNAFGYASRDHFRRDLSTLLTAASSPDETLVVSRLIKQQDEQLATTKKTDTETDADTRDGDSAFDAAASGVEDPRLSGIKWQDAAAVTGLQRHGDGWRCHIRLGDRAIETVVEAPSRDGALRRYGAYCRGLTAAQLRRIATEAAREQRRVDTEVLRDARKQLRPRLPLHRVGADLASGRPDESAKDKSREDAVELGTPTPTPSSASVSVVSTPSPAASAPSSPLLTSRSRRVSDAAIERRVQQRRQLPRMAMLRMRRLIQMRLCRHLEGAAVVARRGDEPEPEAEDDDGDDWTPTARLERGRVVALRDRQRMSLADFVVAELKSSVAACAHLFLVRSRQSIDDHLLECDEIDDALLDRLVVDFKGASESWMQHRRR
ncbi:hypothetical protein PINS_up013157 [Pythium insidiosum]|nr:hypothetical protein PINS_up013157 [Pythium insidiosum]